MNNDLRYNGLVKTACKRLEVRYGRYGLDGWMVSIRKTHKEAHIRWLRTFLTFNPKGD